MEDSTWPAAAFCIQNDSRQERDQAEELSQRAGTERAADVLEVDDAADRRLNPTEAELLC